MRVGLSALALLAALLLGGGSRLGFLGDIAVQLLAVPLLVIGARDWIVRMAEDRCWRADFLLLNLALVAGMFVIFLQLAPWPRDVGQLAVGKDSYLSLLRNSASSAPWGGLVAAPALGWAAIASAIPFFAVFFGTSHLAHEHRAKLAMLVVVIGGLSLLIGFLQVTQGSESDLRFYAITNPSEAVGFFANRNHFAAFLYVTLTLTAVLLTGFGEISFAPAALNTRRAFCLILAAILLIAIMSGVALARSRAGIMLCFVATAGIFVSQWASSRISGRNVAPPATSTRRLLIAVAAFGVIFAVQFGMQRAMTRFEADPFSDLRTTLSPVTAALALQNLPFGTGLGSFEQTYAVSEADADLFSGYANRAHNDWVEFLLETGLPGAIAGGLFLIWLGHRTIAVWKKPPRDYDAFAVMFERPASLIIILLLVHSVVDYPLRTTAISSLFAFAAALLVPPPVQNNTPQPSHTAPELN